MNCMACAVAGPKGCRLHGFQTPPITDNEVPELRLHQPYEQYMEDEEEDDEDPFVDDEYFIPVIVVYENQPTVRKDVEQWSENS